MPARVAPLHRHMLTRAEGRLHANLHATHTTTPTRQKTVRHTHSTTGHTQQASKYTRTHRHKYTCLHAEGCSQTLRVRGGWRHRHAPMIQIDSHYAISCKEAHSTQTHALDCCCCSRQRARAPTAAKAALHMACTCCSLLRTDMLLLCWCSAAVATATATAATAMADC